jgi:abequosyltransferase
MSPTLSISIPIYNFAEFIPETLESILTQKCSKNVEIVILDGASIDNTADIINRYSANNKNIKYIRMPEKGGIDRDMALSVSHATGDYVWLFSGDDWMLPGSLNKVIDQIQSGQDLYLTKHTEWINSDEKWMAWPTVDAPNEMVFNLGKHDQRKDYFERAHNTEAFFSFIGGLIVKRSKWESVIINQNFIGSCWAHAARLCELMRSDLTVKVLTEPFLKRRPDNDSFASTGIVNRYKLAIDGYHKIADEIFGHNSFEAYHIRRAVRNDFPPVAMLLGKYLTSIDPKNESRELMDRLVKKAYCDPSLNSLLTRLNYILLTPASFRRKQPQLSEKFNKIKSIHL